MTPIFYRPEQSCDTDSFSPSAGKPALVMKDWMSDPDIAPEVQVMSFKPASKRILQAIHSKWYVDGVLDGTIKNGFGNTDKTVANSLRYTVGSIVAAAIHVLKERATHPFNVAVSPTSGFHHAHYSHGGGYCTFNGLMAAAVEVHRLGLADRILILDGDNHYGDGTDNIIEKLGIDYVKNITAGKSYRTAEEHLSLFHILKSHVICNTCSDKKYDLILYQAGADIHIDDPLGGILTTEEMKQRDGLVMFGAHARQIPIVVNLAGGYRRDKSGSLEAVLQLHRNTMDVCVRYGRNYAE